MSIQLEELLAGAAQQILNQQQAQAQQATLDVVLKAVNAVLTQVNSVLAVVVNGTYGNAAIQAELATFQSTTAIDFTAVLTAIAATQQAGSPVTLPTHAPTTFLDTIGSSGFAGVWSTLTLGPNPNDYGAVMTGLWEWIEFRQSGFFGAPRNSIYFLAGTNTFPISAVWTSINYPNADTSAILSTDTLVSWLTSQNPAFTVTLLPDNEHVVLAGADPGFFFQCLIDVPHFNALKELLFPLASTLVAPVWPGLSGVTLLTPVAIANGVTITEAMDGCLIAVASYPLNRGQFSFDGVISVRNLGALAFFSDNGDEEFPQTLGFTSAVYLPKSMAHAAGLVLRTTGGVTGTITPFTIP